MIWGCQKEVEKFVRVGDPITRERQLIEMGNCVNCKSIDNRVSVFILIETFRKLKQVPFDVYGVFTVQEEVGIRGANVAAHHIEPDFGIGLDTTIAYDVPGSQPHERVTALGKGAAIKIMDSSTICDARMVEFMKNQRINTKSNGSLKFCKPAEQILPESSEWEKQELLPEQYQFQPVTFTR